MIRFILAFGHRLVSNVKQTAADDVIASKRTGTNFGPIFTYAPHGETWEAMMTERCPC
jgi:hypothetical protein